MNCYNLLEYFVPYKYQDENTIINSMMDKIDGNDRAKKRTVIRRLIKDLERKKLISKKVLFLKSNRSTKERTWAIDSYEKSKRHARETGYIIYTLTKSGFQEYLRTSNCTPLINSLSNTYHDELQWVDPTKRSSHYNYQRMRACIFTYMDDAGIATSHTLRYRPMSGSKEENNSPKTVAEIIRIATDETLCLEASNTSDFFTKHPTLYMKEEFIDRVGKNAYKDNILALLISASKLFPIYHTSDYYGTAWLASSKKETLAALSNFAYSLSLPNHDASEAIIFASNPKEFADLILTAHNIPTNTTRYFGPYKSRSIKFDILGKPFEHLYVMPECEATAKQIKYLITRQDTTPEDTLSTALMNYDSEAEYFDLSEYLLHIAPDPNALCVPEDLAERTIFLTEIFQWGVMLTGKTSEATPVYDCRNMDLKVMSLAYYFYAETNAIGNIDYKNVRYKNMIILCFEWQLNWLNKIFEKAIFFTV